MNIADFHFIRPYWLLALIPQLLILALMLRNKLSQGNWSTVCDEALLPYLLQEKAVNRSRWPLTAGAVAALLMIIALAGPTWERLPSPVFRNDSALVIALDLSRSMDAGDIKPSRLVMARYKIADILKQRKDGQTALLVYAGDAFTVTPLTDDTETIDSQLSALNTDIMPSQGSNTVLALEKAAELFRQAGLQKGQILLITDGVEADKTLTAVKSLDKYSLSILGVGTDDGAPIALPEGGFLKDGRGDIVVPKLNSGELKKLAQAGNGVYQTITTNDADIKTLLATLDKPVKQQDKANENLLLDQWADKGPWLLLPVLPLAALTFRKGLLCFALLLILPLPKNSYAVDWKDLWRTKDQQAQQAYKNQDYAKAAEQFENPDWKAAAHYKAGQYDKALENLKSSKSESSAYNQGNALAKAGQLEQAIKAYDKALAVNPADADAKHNKEVVEKALEKQKQEQKQQDQPKDDKQQSKGDSEQNKDGEQSEKSDDQKPEQKPEQKQSDKQQSEENQQQDKAEQKKPEDEKPQQAEQRKDEAEEQAKQQERVEAQSSKEQQQANEQWLKRIPDDPAGLLKRKFKYQYGQRGRQSSGDAGGW
ncbi:Ca-activated chloride channel family protein [Methylobacter tundripaludum]|uniref:Ca-activated chloride channel family protein n=1 Tax=Methylobacter tundripaludum TaxID=173365 RepID=A0A2S6H215_9GAMM|nr:VWA domain-containing protein [Methylobacter tundripaludum]PPK71528.1 Ca-activated chloride channel family protein [Methylobacter tundripaludum]